MTISSRTPEGLPNECPVCGKRLVIEPSQPTGDAPCPHCGVLLWFVVQQPGLVLFGRAETQEPLPEESAALARHQSRTEQPGSMPVVGERVTVTEGVFARFEGDVVSVDTFRGKVYVEIDVYGGPVIVPVAIRHVSSSSIRDRQGSEASTALARRQWHPVILGRAARLAVRAITQVVVAIVWLLAPLNPRLWLAMARAFSKAPGWTPSMMVLAMCVVLMMVHVWVDRLEIPGADALQVILIVAWATVSSLAMAIIVRNSCANLRRLGVVAARRSRWWFELGGLCWNALFLLVVVCFALSFGARAIHLDAPWIWTMGQNVAAAGFVAFAGTGLVGYALALARWRIPTSRAFQCVNFYLPMIVGIMLLMYAVEHWPPQAVWPEGVQLAGSGVLGASVLGIGLAIGARGWERFEKPVGPSCVSKV